MKWEQVAASGWLWWLMRKYLWGETGASFQNAFYLNWFYKLPSTSSVSKSIFTFSYIQTDSAPGPWAEVSFVARRSGLNSVIKNFGDIKQITTSLHLWVLSVKIPVSDFGEVESAYHRLTRMVLFPNEESPHLLEFEIPLRAFLTIRRDKA